MDLSPSGAPRRCLSVLAIASTLPYLTLKLLWLCGSDVGVVDRSAIHSTTLWVLNLGTSGMDAAVIVLAAALVRPWGQRVPGGLLAFPVWVATGLLGTLMLALLLVLPLNVLLGAEHVAQPDTFLDGWVYVVVYGGFAVQGVALLTGFALYARERWAGLLTSRVGELPDGGTLTLQRVLAWAGAVLTAPVLCAQLYWACGGHRGLPLAALTGPHRSSQVMAGVHAVLAAVACVTVLSLVARYRADRPLLPRFVLAWFSVGSTFAWGAWMLVAQSLSVRVPDRADVIPGVVHLVNALQTTAGLLLLVTGALALVARGSAPADVESAG